MPKIALTRTFFNPDGEELTKNDQPLAEDNSNRLTARDVLIVAVTTEFKEDQQVVDIVQEKLSRFNIYQKLLETTKETEYIEFTLEEAEKLRARVARCFGMLVSGVMIKMLSAA